MASAHIYGLEDPRTGLVRYVGKSVDPPERLRSHLRRSDKGTTYCARWIRALKRIGLEPVLVVLEGPCEDWEEAERRWIAFFGMQLTNMTSGGDGPYDLVRTPKHCAKIGLANKRRNWTPEMRENASNGQKKRFAASGGMTEVARLKQSLVRKGKKWTRPMSDQGRANIATARTGTKDSPEARANKSTSQRARYDGPNGQSERAKAANRGKRNGRYGRPYTAPKASCVGCRRDMAVHALPNHIKACQQLGLAKELLRVKLAAGPQLIRTVMAEAKESGISEKTIQKAVKELDVQRLGSSPLAGYQLYSLP